MFSTTFGSTFSWIAAMKIDPGDRPGYCRPGKLAFRPAFLVLLPSCQFMKFFGSVRREKMFNGNIRRGKSWKDGILTKLEANDLTHAVMIALKRGFLGM
jgi:hypothetical protein